LRTRFHKFFQFVFYGFILVSWFKSRVWQVDPSWLYLFSRSFLIEFFFIKLRNFFDFLFTGLSRSSWPESQVWQVDPNLLCLFFILFLIKYILFFNFTLQQLNLYFFLFSFYLQFYFLILGCLRIHNVFSIYFLRSYSKCLD
jgi:hypothetical protein